MIFMTLTYDIIALTYDTVHHPILLCESTIMIIAFIVINTV